MTLVPRKRNVLSNKTRVTMDVENNTALALVGGDLFSFWHAQQDLPHSALVEEQEDKLKRGQIWVLPPGSECELEV